MPTFKLTIAYDGTNFSGWQFQPDCRTVQGAVQEAWQQITGEEVSARASSRTDAGVHALGNVVSIESNTHLVPAQLYNALNATLPRDIVVVSIEEAPVGFNATRDAKRKRYRYYIHNARTKPLFNRNYAWHVPKKLDAQAMWRAGQILVGTHDFASFQSAGSERENTIRTIKCVLVAHRSHHIVSVPPVLTIDVEGDGFLYNMVRIIAGSLVDVGAGRRDAEWLAAALAACDRRSAGRTAPPQGLCLLKVFY